MARDFIVDHGYPEFMHAFGHMMGRVAYDGTTILGRRWEKYKGICELPVKVGNIFTLELHVMVEGRGMMSLEEDVVVTGNGIEYLSKPQTELCTLLHSSVAWERVRLVGMIEFRYQDRYLGPQLNRPDET